MGQAPNPDQPTTPRHIIIDADPGVDDCFAILLGLRSPEVDVDAITIVFGNVPVSVGTQTALRMVEVAGRTDVPIALGAVQPLVRNYTFNGGSHGFDGMLGQAKTFPEPKTRPVDTPAIELMRSLIYKNPGQESIVAIGPLTNVATLLRSYPEIAAAEANIWHDPEAAQIVFHSGIPITAVGLNVTNKLEFKEEYVRRLEASSDPVAQAAARLGRAGVQLTDQGPVGRVLHDPLAMAAFIDPTIIETKDCRVEVETAGEFTAGETVDYCSRRFNKSEPLLGEPALQPSNATAEANPLISKVAVDVNLAKYYQLLMSRLLGTSLH
jgi:pyrimidine-specific ribonucleoside hydrolase